MHEKKLISKKSPKCSLIVRLSFTRQKHINAENGESNGYTDINVCLLIFLKCFLYNNKINEYTLFEDIFPYKRYKKFVHIKNKKKIA